MITEIFQDTLFKGMKFSDASGLPAETEISPTGNPRSGTTSARD